MRVGSIRKPMPQRWWFSPSFLAFTIATLLFVAMITKDYVAKTSYLTYTLPVVVGGWIIGLTGLVDDDKKLSPWLKMLGIFLGG